MPEPRADPERLCVREYHRARNRIWGGDVRNQHGSWMGAQ